jgi:hypothetical protein
LRGERHGLRDHLEPVPQGAVILKEHEAIVLIDLIGYFLCDFVFVYIWIALDLEFDADVSLCHASPLIRLE